MASARTKWIDVDLDGLRKLLERRSKEFALYELVQNIAPITSFMGRKQIDSKHCTNR
jgi:hypothetical protein